MFFEEICDSESLFYFRFVLIFFLGVLQACLLIEKHSDTGISFLGTVDERNPKQPPEMYKTL